MTMFRVGPAGIPASLKTDMNAVLNKKFETTGQNYPPSGWPDDVNLLGPLPVRTASGAVASFSDGADDVPLKKCEVTIPANLTGVSSVGVAHCGKNLFDASAEPFQTDKYIIVTPTVIGSSDFTYSGNVNYNVYRIKVAPNSTYTISNIKANSPAWGVMDSDGKVTQCAQNNGGTSGVDITITTGAKDVFLFLSIGISGTYKCDDIVQVETGSTATDYERFVIDTHTANLGRTIYGGSVDVVNGTGTDNCKKIALGDFTWIKSGTEGNFYCQQITDLWYPSEGGISRYGIGVSDKFEFVQGTPTDGQINAYFNTAYSGFRIFIKKTDYSESTSAEFKEYLHSINAHLVYKVNDATAEDFTFTPVPINSYLGNNNLWSDTGDTECEYYADIDLALQAVSGSRGLMMSSLRSAEPMIGEESDPEEINELEEPEITEQEGDNDAR